MVEGPLCLLRGARLAPPEHDWGEPRVLRSSIAMGEGDS
ncbi:MAG: hypothetical protein AVDCRST_MAG49-85 [uncultured Thermomicrobiales bacterium]|uniref:Uncharacterized protein n=1 Tax=uncultured Thermomicrobiales bacterium TaxID=1645740 RepID=A0A6J4TVZ6_9BACT|nr:MAG: hypothetical protein AVDCRST_MAG49-85 [uncultured Thermomicrobiales bacterium]